MILNSDTIDLIRANALRLAQSIRSKDDLVDLATASSFDQVFAAIETILTNTEMYFDDQLISSLTLQSWQNFKATLLVFTLNIVNKNISINNSQYHQQGLNREFAASLNHM